MSNEFNAENIKETLLSLENTQDSIIKASSRFLSLNRANIAEASKIFFESFNSVIQSSLLKDKILNYVYLSNDILQKAKNASKDDYLRAFEAHLPLTLDILTKKIVERDLLKETLKILKLWQERGVYQKEFIDEIVTKVENTIVEKRNEERDNIPEFDFDISELVAFANARKKMQISKEKFDEKQDHLNLLLKKPATSTQQTQAVEQKLSELKELYEKLDRSKTEYFQAKSQLLKECGVSHVKAVHELQKVLEVIDKVKNFD